MGTDIKIKDRKGVVHTFARNERSTGQVSSLYSQWASADYEKKPKQKKEPEFRSSVIHPEPPPANPRCCAAPTPCIGCPVGKLK